jgi:glyoxylase-like metal-dependent hydrolase (beta-lactamase superfamily II)
LIGADRYAWTEAGPHEVAPGVHRIPCPLPNDGLRAVNVYAIEQRSGLALIDSGWRADATLAALEAGLHGLGAGFADVTIKTNPYAWSATARKPG